MSQFLRITAILTFWTFPFAGLCQSNSPDSTKNELIDPVEQMPEFPGGTDSLNQYIVSKTKYPDGWKVDSIQGKVFIQFIVEQNGTVSNPEIVRGLNPTLDSIAISMFNEMPNWSPATQQGIPVTVKYIFLVNFGNKR